MDVIEARTTLMTETAMRVEELRQEGLAKIRANRIEEALPLFDQALGIVEDDTTRELLVINKAGALIQLEQDAPEVQQLPQIIMRRRSVRHVYVAAYHLQHKFLLSHDFKRSASYGKVALQAAEESGDVTWKFDVLVSLGNACVYDSKTAEAIEHYESVLSLVPRTPENALRISFTLQNLGYCKLLEGETERGIELIHEAIALMHEAGADGYVAESFIDLCYGYLELSELELAKSYGEKGLELATEVRQVRNAHYLLGEVAYKLGDSELAEYHFDKLAKFYPDFPHLKDLLLAIDLRGMVNLKL